jgi:uncharacterized protein (TIGR02996 family)
MTFHEGFFRALQEEPEDDAVRLVYADFLEEHGDEAATARAELIRVQVELAALAPLSRRAAVLTAQQNELLARWERIWLGDWADVLGGWAFRRGFVEAVRADASVFLDNAAAWFAEWPTLAAVKLTRARGHFPELTWIAGIVPCLPASLGLHPTDEGVPLRGASGRLKRGVWDGQRQHHEHHDHEATAPAARRAVRVRSNRAVRAVQGDVDANDHARADRRLSLPG